MGLRYNKEYVSKDRRIQTSGPRDMQRRLASISNSPPEVDHSLIMELRSTIRDLQEQIKVKSNGSKESFTAEQVNEEIIKAVKAETYELKDKYEAKIKQLEMDRVDLNNKIKSIVEEKDKKEAELVLAIEQVKNEIEKERSVFRDQLKAKDELIIQIQKSNSGISEDKLASILEEKIKELALTAGHSIENVDPNRPKMEKVFIDPIDKEPEIETHINISDSVVSKKEEMASQVDKLKSLLGKLPNKK